MAGQLRDHKSRSDCSSVGQGTSGRDNITKKLHIKTYGCQMNVYDSEKMAELMIPKGYALVDEPDQADLVILNTCHIREKASEKVYSDVGRLRQLKEKRADQGKNFYLAIAGCVAQAEGAEMIARAPVIDMVFGPQTYHRLPDMVEKAAAMRALGKSSRVLDTEFPAEDKFDFISAGNSSALGQSDLSPRNPSAFLTIQEGCDKFCTFCVVPYTRGAEFSRPVAAIRAEAERLVAQGVQEITLLGQNVNAYHGEMIPGKIAGKTANLALLIEELATVSGLSRIRYTTSHPRDMDDHLIAVHRDVEACMPYLHLPVQSGSDFILEAMNRGHTADHYKRVIDKLRRARPDIALSSDFIVGFPGETEKDFEATLDLVKHVTFAQSYSFKYSARPGTPASLKKDQLSEQEKLERLHILQAVLKKQQADFNHASIGQEMSVLAERQGREPGQLVGRSPYLQAVHIAVSGGDDDGGDAKKYVDPLAKKPTIGDMVKVKIIDAAAGSLKGKWLG